MIYLWYSPRMEIYSKPLGFMNYKAAPVEIGECALHYPGLICQMQ